ncbi:MAG: hypothetical protein ABIP97_00270, partial [Chthoniobacterales bacterium]
DIQLSCFESQFRFYISCVVHIVLLTTDVCTHLSDKDGLERDALRAFPHQSLPRAVLSDHVSPTPKHPRTPHEL